MSFSEQNIADITKCVKDRNPVLLHRDLQKNIFNRVHLIEAIHKKETGCKQLDSVEFIKTEEVPTRELLINGLGRKLNKALTEEFNKRNKKAIDTRTISHEHNKIDKKATGSRIDLQRAQFDAHGFDVPEGLSDDIVTLAELDVLRIEADAKDRAFRIEVESVLMQWQDQTPKKQLIIEIENKVREHFKSTAKSFCEIDFADDKGKDVYSFLMQKQVVDNIEILHDPVLNKPLFSVPIYESFLLDFKGTIFLNNLGCDPDCREDDHHYLQIVKIIKQKPSCWLVAYTDSPEYFSGIFKDPEVFKLIRLEDGITGSMLDAIITESEGCGEVAVTTKIPKEDQNDEIVFCKDGERCYIKFKEEELKPENLDGFGFIHYLIYYGKKITPKKLHQAVKGVTTSNKDEEDSVETYTVDPREIEKEQHRELKKHHSHIESIPLERMLEKLDKNKIKTFADKLREAKKNLLNKKGELEEEGRSLDVEDIIKEINDTQHKIDIITRLDHNPEHKRYRELVSKAIKKAKEKIKSQSIMSNYDSLLIWNHFEDSIVYNDFHFSYKPTSSINWKL